MPLFALWVLKQAANNEIKIRENPLYAPMFAFAAVTLVQLIFGWTAYRHDTFSHALLYLAYRLFAFLASQCLRRSSQAKTLAVVVSAFGVGLADSPNAARRLVLWPLRQSHHYCGPDGNAGADPAGVLPDALR